MFSFVESPAPFATVCLHISSPVLVGTSWEEVVRGWESAVTELRVCQAIGGLYGDAGFGSCEGKRRGADKTRRGLRSAAGAVHSRQPFLFHSMLSLLGAACEVSYFAEL